MNSLLCLFLFGVASATSPTTWPTCRPITDDSLTVHSHLGTIHGMVNLSTPCVRRFLGIPYSKPPIHERRFRPPVPVDSYPGGSIDAFEFGPSCPQFFLEDPPLVYNRLVSEFNLEGLNETSYDTSEDCLSLSVYTPSVKPGEKLPVIIFIHGGAFNFGGQNIPYQIPANWVQDSQKHIVVTFNYRLNILGFPNAAGLNPSERNVGLLDQREVVKWVRDNIEAFGGDTKRITLWGHSAGSISAGWYQYAYTEDKDPIVSGIVMGSGTEIFPGARASTEDVTHGNFTGVAKHFGCNKDSSSAEEELRCMQSVDVNALEEFLKEEMVKLMTGQPGALYFTAVADNVTVFKSYRERAAEGKILHVPTIIGTDKSDGLVFVPLGPNGVNQTIVDGTTEVLFFCPSVEAAQFRIENDIPVFRFLYAGNFSNVSPEPYLGAYHGSELPLIFGTAGEYRGASTPEEITTGDALQDSLEAFMSDRVEGLEKLGWPQCEDAVTCLVREFGGVPVVQDISLEAFAAACPPRIPGALDR
ncbi:Alpha/Beta hydrolase protein [Podospora fimiseda]|uniref:Carboxylic ester hydrolase n=1 Tax=Podospora fimiseda TaxID=252190 RepID=A0AAN7H3Z4_9PEZI|nr:Alpha/Beta hydrolase protein [Podospora fimiseda]